MKMAEGADKFYGGMPSDSNASDLHPAALTPQQKIGQARVALILKAAADAFRERGYHETTMREIAKRSETNSSSLYRIFPNKELIAIALLELYTETFEKQWDGVMSKAPHVAHAEFCDLLLDVYTDTYKKHNAILTLLEDEFEGSIARDSVRKRNLERIEKAVRTHAPSLKRRDVKKIAVIMLYNMRTLISLSFDPFASNAPGASNELRASVKIYLTERLSEIQ
ncbi:MAG: TetR/AcrR family transcriptional regulator [Burkholderiaceae bacterium]|nr:TetR/AcrR family transcriptional regulator [Burkholderiaceae bacterium]